MGKDQPGEESLFLCALNYSRETKCLRISSNVSENLESDGWVEGVTEGRCLGLVPTLAGSGAAVLAAGAEHHGEVQGRKGTRAQLQDQHLLGETRRTKKSQDPLNITLHLGPSLGGWMMALSLPWSLDQACTLSLLGL